MARNLEKASAVAVLLAAAGLPGSASAAETSADLLDLSIEELAGIRVTTASRVEESLQDVPAATYVITAEDIRRSGVTSIPEALRLAPGVEVARRSTHAWSISIRGFNSDLSNKLLVLIDGRSVYSPLYAGVFWDVQDVFLEDVDRIEVVAGPGGTLWGANAVNGVINIITRPADETRGGFAEIGGGNEEQGFGGLRFGGTLGDDVAARVYVKYADRDSSMRPGGADGVDGMRMARTGFRLDWDSGDSPGSFTLQGDAYEGDKDGEFLDPFTFGTLPAGSSRGLADVSGANVLGRWTRELGDGSDLRLQAYYDHTSRDIPNAYGEKRDTFDLDFQHHVELGDRNNVIWGLGLRATSDEVDNSTFSSFIPDERFDRTYSAFIQDEIALRPDKLFLTLGAKLEENDYTGSETQPNVRLAWLVDERQTFWAAVSRAVRIPSRLDADLRLAAPFSAPGIPFPVYVVVNGNDDFDSEELLAREAGYRIQATDALYFDVTVFSNEYDGLQTAEPLPVDIVLDPLLPYAVVPNRLENGMEGDSAGATLATVWRPTSAWQLRFHYSRLDMDLSLEPGSLNGTATSIAGNSPEHTLAVHSFVDLPRDLSLYTGVRFVDDLPNQGIEDYTAVDLSLHWRPRDRMSTSVTVRNLNDDRHREFTSGASNVIERSTSLRFAWSF